MLGKKYAFEVGANCNILELISHTEDVIALESKTNYDSFFKFGDLS